MTVLCSLKNINLAFGQKAIFNDATFQIEHGDKIGLIGLNGMGKSSLFNILLENIQPDTSTPPFVFDKSTDKMGARYGYSVFLIDQKFRLPKKETKIRDYFYEYYPQIKDLHDKLEIVNQEVESSHSEASINKQHELMEELERRNVWELTNTFESYLKAFDLKDLDRDVRGLSGGEQRKILLALGLTSDANLVLWDEPTNHLDMETINSFEEELLKTDKTFIVISHDRYLLSKVTKKIFHINRAQVTSYKGSYADYVTFLDDQEESRKRMLTKLRNSLRRETDWMRQGIRARGTRSKKRVERFDNLSQTVTDLKNEARKSMELMINKSGRKTKMLCEFKDVSFAYDEKQMFNSINFSLFKGDKIGVIGGNGIGKSTLMKLISKQLQPTSGVTKYADELKVCYFSQTKDELNLDLSPFELLGDGEDFIHFKDGRSVHVATYFQNYLFSLGELHRPLSTFSGGELNRLQLALNLKNEADIWIFDEPTNDLDIESIEILEQKLAQFDGTVIIISHDRTFLENVTNKIWLVKDLGLTIFTSGYSHVAPYLEACALEEEILKDQGLETNIDQSPVIEPVPSPVQNQEKEEKTKLTQKQKLRLEKLPQLIQEKEGVIEQIDQLLAQFDYSNLDEQKSELISNLSTKKEQTEEVLLEFYDELEALS